VNRVAVISDIHGNILALEQVAADIKRRGVDAVFNLGDHVSGPLWPRETIEYLIGQDWIHIAGNHDRQIVETNPQGHGLSDRYAFQRLDEAQRQWLMALPGTIAIEEGLLLFHGSPSSDTTYLLETIEHGRGRLASRAEITRRLGGAHSPVMLCGHTHIPRAVALPGTILIVNPGSVGLPAYSDEVPHPHVLETGSPHARYAILERRAGQWNVELIMVSYDHERAAGQARRNDRPDWSAGLQTGFATV